jgi:hypothetical protein
MRRSSTTWLGTNGRVARAVVASIAIALVAASPVFGMVESVSASASTSDGDLSEGPDCTPWHTDRVVAVDDSGVEKTPTDNDGLRRRYYMTSPSGISATQTLPRKGWKMSEASDGELAEHGLPPRPKDQAALADWNRFAANAHVADAGYCETKKTNNATSGNWSGQLNNTMSFTNTETIFAQTGFDSVCPHASSYSSWSGLGGYYSKNLLQAGTDTSQSGLNTIYAWWEALSTKKVLTEQEFSGSSVAPGDTVVAYTQYSGGQASMSVYDQTSGNIWATGYMSTIGGLAASTYYDGSTSEYITEAPTGGSAPGGLYYLRKPHLGNTLFTQAQGNGSSAGSIGGFGINEYDGTTGDTMQQATAISGNGAWYDNWSYCD